MTFICKGVKTDVVRWLLLRVLDPWSSFIPSGRVFIILLVISYCILVPPCVTWPSCLFFPTLHWSMINILNHVSCLKETHLNRSMINVLDMKQFKTEQFPYCSSASLYHKLQINKLFMPNLTFKLISMYIHHVNIYLIQL